MNATSLINISIEIFGVVLSFIIIIYLIVNDTKNTKLNRLFIRVLLCNIVNLLSDAACWAVMGNTKTYAFIINYAGTLLMYVFNYIILVAFADYLFAYISSKTKVSKKYVYTTRVLTVFAILLIILSQFTQTFYYIDATNIYHRTDLFIYVLLSEVLCMLTIGAMIVHYRKKLGKWEIVFLSSYIVLPVLAAVTQFMFYGIATIYIAATLSVLIIFLGIQSEQAKLLKQQELELTQSSITIMLSQIQPHFLYNVLGSIRQLCHTDPNLASETLTEFSHYLRGNLDSLTQKTLIMFDTELKHVKNYLALEQKRFDERLHIVYNIAVMDFMLPTLTVQLIVENAVRYGVTKKENGGTIVIGASETDDGFEVYVADDGVGFDPNQPEQDGRSHVGIQNVRNRLAAMCGGTLDIVSGIGTGTTVTIKIPKS